MNRQGVLQELKAGDSFDLLVIGGGATGCGVALDAASRGLKVALVEKNDFAEGTSSRSTKLVHGGVRYLEMAVRQLDRDQYQLVRDGLRERAFLLRNAPYLARPLPLVTPLYRWRDVPYVFCGLKLYDLLAGKRSLGGSRLLSRKAALSRFPALKSEGLKAGVLYYDGQFHDARMAIALALTARQLGASVVNHVAVSGFCKERGRISGAHLTDSLTGERWSIKARGVVNATGPFVDQLRQLDEPGTANLLSVSSGVHLVLDRRFAPPDTGLLIPETEDGRILFVLPWENHALVGTTDEPARVTEHPFPREAEVDYLLRHLCRYFNLQLGKADIKAVWSGLRPLVADPQGSDSARLSRDHIIEVSSSGLLTIAGGKWTTYRKMAQDTVDSALKNFALQAPRPHCQTEFLPLYGADESAAEHRGDWGSESALPADVASYLQRTYGDRAQRVAELARAGQGARLVAAHPMLEAEVRYAVREELAERPLDVLARRLPLALLDTAAAREALPRVVELMAAELSWSTARCQEESALANKRLDEGL